MTKDDLLRIMKMYVTISDEYMHNYPQNDDWKHSLVNQDYIDTLRREGKLELLKELMGMFEHGE